VSTISGGRLFFGISGFELGFVNQERNYINQHI